MPDGIWDVVVIGGGPAGMMAAGRAAQLGSRVLLLEKNGGSGNGLGKKLLITGGGRCNVTNAELDTRKLLSFFNKNSDQSDQFLFSAFSQWSVKETLDFFHIKNMPTKVEAEKRVFPVSNSAQSVWNVLVDYIQSGKVTTRSNSPAIGFVAKENHITGVKLKNGEVIEAKNFILATGGKSRPETGSSGDGFIWLKELGHTVTEPSASLVPVKTKESWIKNLTGVSLPKIKISLIQNEVKQESRTGKILFTHFGVSGPTILNLSKDIGELLKYGEVFIELDLLVAFDYGQLNEKLQTIFVDQAKKKIKNALGPDTINLPSALIAIILDQSKIDGETFCHSITREERLNLVKTLKHLRIQATGLLGEDKAIVTSGGISLKEVDFKTMQSRLYPNLFLVGDILNIDRPSGGYSLQLCWTTGFVAGTAAAQEKTTESFRKDS